MLYAFMQLVRVSIVKNARAKALFELHIQEPVSFVNYSAKLVLCLDKSSQAESPQVKPNQASALFVQLALMIGILRYWC